MKKIKDLLFDLESKVEFNLDKLSKLKEEKNNLLEKNKILIDEKNELHINFKSLEKRFNALKIANTISNSEININETRTEIDLLIKEIDLCISQLSN